MKHPKTLPLILIIALFTFCSTTLAETGTPMPMSTLSLLATVGFDGSDCRLSDAALLPNGEAILIGNLTTSGEESMDGWAARIDLATGAKTWQYRRTETDGQTYIAAAPNVDGFILVRTDKKVSVLEFWGADNALERQVELNGSITDIAVDPDGGFVAVGQKDEKPWIVRLKAAGDPLWEYCRETELEGLYTCVSILNGFTYAGGAELWHVDLMDRFSWAGTRDAWAMESDAGNIQMVRGFAYVNIGTVVAGGINDGGDGTSYATSCALAPSLGGLTGPYIHSLGSGFNQIISIQDPGVPESSLPMACGFETREDGVQSYAAVLSYQCPDRVWSFPFGTESEARVLIQLEGNKVLMIGHGNGVGIGKESQPGIRVYLVEVELPSGMTPEANG